MATLKEFEEALRANGMNNALAILETLKKRDREKRSVAPARRVAGRKMTAELAREILAFHATTSMTQQEIAFKLGVNQGRVNEVIKRGKWLGTEAGAQEFKDRDKAMQRLRDRARERRAVPAKPASRRPAEPPKPTLPMQRPVRPAPLTVANAAKPPARIVSAQLAFLDL